MFVHVEALIEALEDEVESWCGQVPEQVSVPGAFLQDVLQALDGKMPVAPAVESVLWIDVRDALPATDDQVLAVKERKDGSREICLARCMKDYKYFDYNSGTEKVKPKWLTGGSCNIIYWRKLPAMPMEVRE